MFYPVINSNIPPLYYLIVRSVLPFGNEEFILRFPSLIFGLLSIVVFFLIVRNWLGTRIALICMVLISISPFHVWYSQEARPYILLLLLALVSIWLLQLLLQEPKNFWVRVAFVLSVAATVYSHTIAIAFIAFLGAYVGMARRREEVAYWLSSFAAITLLIMPALYLLIRTPPTGSADALRSFNPLSLLYVVWTFTTGFSLGPTLGELHTPDRLSSIIGYLPLILPTMFLVCGLVVLGAHRLRMQNILVYKYVILWFLFPIAFAVLGSVVSVHPFNVRYAILSFPAFMIVLACGIEGVPNERVRLVTFAIILLVSGLSLNNYYHHESYQRENNRAAGRFLARHALPNDLVIAYAPYTAKNLHYYHNKYKRYDITITRYRGMLLEDVNDQLSKTVNNTIGSDGAAKSPIPIVRDIGKMINGRDRFWIFLSRAHQGNVRGNLIGLCDKDFQNEVDVTWNDARLLLCSKRNTLASQSESVYPNKQLL
jgi:4-amino-4-deoxy-L-arabinose transferase-like glycosyltransferase